MLEISASLPSIKIYRNTPEVVQSPSLIIQGESDPTTYGDDECMTDSIVGFQSQGAPEYTVSFI